MPTKVVLIAARSWNGVIGLEGKLPWIIREDLQHFKHATLGRPMVVGSRTFHSMPKSVWETRKALVLSRTAQHIPGAAAVANNLASLIEIGRQLDVASDPQVIIAGGAEVYKLALEGGFVDEMLISEVRQSYIGDVYFPNVPTGMFAKGVVESEHNEFNVVRYKRWV